MDDQNKQNNLIDKQRGMIEGTGKVYIKSNESNFRTSRLASATNKKSTKKMRYEEDSKR